MLKDNSKSSLPRPPTPYIPKIILQISITQEFFHRILIFSFNHFINSQKIILKFKKKD